MSKDYLERARELLYPMTGVVDPKPECIVADLLQRIDELEAKVKDLEVENARLRESSSS